MQTEEQKKKRKKILKIVGALVAVTLLVSCCGIGGLAFLGTKPTTTPIPVAKLVITVVASSTPTVTTMPTLTPTRASAATPRLTWTPQSTNEREAAQVIQVIDGDTIKVEIVETVYTVRYIGIDTPETVHPSKPVEWMGPEASEANKRLVEGQTVYLEKDVSETDRYGRLLRYIFLTDGLFVNAELVRLGYAQVSTYPPDVRYQDLFLEMQQEARGAKRGLWRATPTALPPTKTPVVQPTQPPQLTAVSTEPPVATLAPTLPTNTSVPMPGPSWWMCPESTEGAAYVGSIRSDPLKFHKLSCHWASKIGAANRICFASRQAALDLGYRPCKVCNP